jgi:hypothetical protein
MTRRARGKHPKRYRNRRSGSVYFSGWKYGRSPYLRTGTVTRTKSAPRDTNVHVVRSVIDTPEGPKEIIEVLSYRIHWRSRRSEQVTQVAYATPASRVDKDLDRERLYVWRGKRNKQARKIWEQIKDQIPSDSWFDNFSRRGGDEYWDSQSKTFRSTREIPDIFHDRRGTYVGTEKPESFNVSSKLGINHNKENR